MFYDERGQLVTQLNHTTYVTTLPLTMRVSRASRYVGAQSMMPLVYCSWRRWGRPPSK